MPNSEKPSHIAGFGLTKLSFRLLRPTIQLAVFSGIEISFPMQELFHSNRQSLIAHLSSSALSLNREALEPGNGLKSSILYTLVE
jgi:hypothetical protein